jgi:hypothetical protein
MLATGCFVVMKSAAVSAQRAKERPFRGRSAAAERCARSVESGAYEQTRIPSQASVLADVLLDAFVPRMPPEPSARTPRLARLCAR